MPFKESTSTTTSSSVRTSNVQTGAKQYQTTSTTRRKLTRGEVATGLLSTSTQLGMIGITIITLILTQPVNQFNKQDLISFTPNYGVNNEYIAVENPLEHYNYQQFGEGVIDRLWAWIQPIEQLGRSVNGMFETLMDLVMGEPLSNSTLGAFDETFGNDRQYQLYLISRETGSNARVFDAMTTAEKNWIVDNNLTTTGEEALFGFTRFHLIYWDSLELFGGGIKWWFTEPTVIDIAIQEGYGT
jgi:hypothetical protein